MSITEVILKKVYVPHLSLKIRRVLFLSSGAVNVNVIVPVWLNPPVIVAESLNCATPTTLPTSLALVATRSEERRVGRVWWARWSIDELLRVSSGLVGCRSIGQMCG